VSRRHLRHARRRLLSVSAWRTRLVFWAGAVAVGLSATGLAIGSDYANDAFQWLLRINPLLPLVLCPAGLVLITWITERYVPEARGSGIPQTMAALEMREHAARSRVLSLGTALGKSGLILGGLLAGASIGREGPTVHIGASLLFALGALARFPQHDTERGLILAGGAAGIAAAFNAPLAGVVFAIEEMSRSFEERTSGTMLTGVIIAGVTALAVLGNYAYLGTVTASLDPPTAWVAVLVCGIIGGTLGGVFSALLLWGQRQLASERERHPFRLAAACGLSLAAFGLLSHGLTYGTGYEEAKRALSGEGVGGAFAYLKMAATLVSYWSGIPGGLFAPSLAAGAGLGQHLAHWFPPLPPEGVAVLGMVAFFAGVVQTPITAFVIVMEMTANQSFVLPLMATAFIAYWVSRLFCPEPLYRSLAQEFLPGGTRPPPEAKGPQA
jgi:H+/Cl- antiporter ClcA